MTTVIKCQARSSSSRKGIISTELLISHGPLGFVRMETADYITSADLTVSEAVELAEALLEHVKEQMTKI